MCQPLAELVSVEEFLDFHDFIVDKKINVYFESNDTVSFCTHFNVITSCLKKMYSFGHFGDDVEERFRQYAIESSSGFIRFLINILKKSGDERGHLLEKAFEAQVEHAENYGYKSQFFELLAPHKNFRNA